MNKNDKIVDQNKFDMIKSMLKGGAPVPEISRFTGYSPTTIYKISCADSLEHYKDVQNGNKYRRKRDTADTESAGGIVVSSYQQNRMIELHKETNELLKLISNKLAFIVEELAGAGRQEAQNEVNA